MRLGLALALVMSLVVSPLAMAGELGSSDTNFLFSKDQVTATTISTQEMQDVQGAFTFFGFEIPDSFDGQCVGCPIVEEANNSIFNLCPTDPDHPSLGGCSISIP